MVEDLFDVAWTPDFTEDLLLAVEYLRNRLRAPKAARDLYDGVVEALENQRAMPTAAVVKWGANSVEMSHGSGRLFQKGLSRIMPGRGEGKMMPRYPRT